MTYQDLVEKGLLKQARIKWSQVTKSLQRAKEDIVTAKLLLPKGYEEAAYKLAYDAMLMAGRALVFSYGLRPRLEGSHRIVVDFTKAILGDEYKVLVKRFDRMRQRRHDIVYEAGPASPTEAKGAIETAIDFIERIEEFIHNKNPQKKLF